MWNLQLALTCIALFSLYSCGGGLPEGGSQKVTPLSVQSVSPINSSNYKSFTLRGRCPVDGANIELLIYGSVVGQTTCSSSSWEIAELDLSYLRDISELQLTISDGSRHTSVNVAKDTELPEVDFGSERPNIRFDNHQGYTISGSCSDKGAVALEVVEDASASPRAVLVGAVSAPCNGEAWSISDYDVSRATGGEVDLVLTMLDDALNRAGEKVTRVMRDIEPPMVGITTSEANTPITSLNMGSYSLEGTCEGTASVHVAIGSLPTNVLACSSGIWTLSSKVISNHELSEGRVDITVSQEDEIGNVGSSLLPVVKDTRGPLLTLSTEGLTVNALTQDSSRLQGGGCEGSAMVTLTLGGETPVTIACSQGQWVYAVPASLLEGSFAISVEQVDEYGNPGAFLSPQPLLKDITLPTFALVSEGINAANESAYYVRGTCSEAGSTMVVAVEGIVETQMVTCLASGQWQTPLSFNAESIADASTVTLTGRDVQDIAGNGGADIEVDIAKNNSALAVAIDPASLVTINSSNQSAYAVRGTCRNGSIEVTLEIAGVSGTGACNASGNWQWTITLDLAAAEPAIDDGDAIVVTATYGSADDTVTTTNVVKKDTTLPVVAVSSTATITVASQGVYEISGTCSEEGTVTVVVGSLEPEEASCGQSASTWSLEDDVSALTETSVTITADMTDTSGNQAVQVSASVSRLVVTVVDVHALTASETTHGVGSVISVQVNFSHSVTIDSATSDQVRIPLEFGSSGSSPLLSYDSGSGTTSILFQYTVVQGDNDEDGIVVKSPISLGSSGSLVETADSVAVGLSFTDSHLATVIIDTSPPVVSITSTPVIDDSNYAAYLLSGACNEGGTLTISHSGREAYTGAENCLEGTWSALIDASDLVAGDIVFSASVTDDWGNTGTSAPAMTVKRVTHKAYPLSILAAGATHSCLVNNSRRPYGGVDCWGGDADQGHLLGAGSTSGSSVALPVKSLDGTGELSHVFAVAAHQLATCALTGAGKVLCWGREDTLGINSTSADLFANLPVFVKSSDGLANLEGIVQVSMGPDGLHTCALARDTGVWCWGSGGDGRLGNGLSTSAPLPVRVLADGANDAPPLRGVSMVSAGVSHSCALKYDGSVQCWGKGGSGALGNGETPGSQTTPVDVMSVGTGADTLSGVVQVASGDEFSCAVTAVSEVVCWGSGTSGQLGDGNTSDSSRPVAVLAPSGESGSLGNILQIAVGSSHACALSDAHTVYCWGNYTNGRLGSGASANATLPEPVIVQSGGGSIQDIVAISLGKSHSCGARSSGDIYCWGSAANGRLGDNNSTSDQDYPVQVLSGASALFHLAGSPYLGGHACAVDGNSCFMNPLRLSVQKPYSSGVDVAIDVSGLAQGYSPSFYTDKLCAERVEVGNLSFFNSTTITVPGPLSAGTRGLYLKQSSPYGNISCSPFFVSFYVDPTPPPAPPVVTVAASGTDSTPELTIAPTTEGRLVSIFTDSSCSQLVGGPFYTAEGSTTVSPAVPLRSTGASRYYVQIMGARGFQSDCSSASGEYRIHLKSRGASLRSVAITSNTICAINSDTTVSCWGGRDRTTTNRSLGTGDTSEPQYASTKVLGLGGIVSLAAMSYTVCALQDTGKIYCWGAEATFETLGNGDDAENFIALSPVEVVGIDNAVQISRGSYSGCAVLANTQVKCWGSNDDGQLGIMAGEPVASPLTVMDGESPLEGVVQVSCAGEGTEGESTCAVMLDGGVKCWGSNALGQLGNGQEATNGIRPVGVQRSGSGAPLHSIVSVVAGGDSTCALDSAGKVFCWGSRTSQAFAAGSQGMETRAVPINGVGGNGELSGVITMAASTSDSYTSTFCALLEDRTVVCWGKGGRNGDNSWSERLYPDYVHAGVKLGDDTPPNLQGVVDLVGNRGTTCALMANGLLKCWGNNIGAKLGIGRERTSVSTSIYPTSVLSGDRTGGQANLYRPALGRSYLPGENLPFNSLSLIRLSLSSAESSPSSNDTAINILVTGISAGQSLSLFSDIQCTASVQDHPITQDSTIAISNIAEGTHFYYAKLTYSNGESICLADPLTYVLDQSPPPDEFS